MDPAVQPLPPPPPTRPFGQVRFGALALTPTFGISHIGVDMNVQNSGGEPKPDFTFTVGPALRAELKTTRLRVEALTGAGYVYYKTYASQRGINPGIQLSADYRVSTRLTVYTRDQFIFTKDRPSVEVDIRSRRLTTDLAVGVSYAFTPKVALSLEGREYKEDYDPGAVFRNVRLQQTLNHVRKSASLGVGYQLTPYTTIRGSGGAEQERFDFSPERNRDSNMFSVGALFSPKARISGDATIGYRVTKSLSSTQPNASGLTLDGRLLSALTNTTGITVGMHRDIAPSYDILSPYYLQNNYDGAIDQRLGRRFSVGASYHAYGLGYRSFVALPGQSTPGNAEALVRSYGVNFGFLTERWGRYGIYVERWERRSGQDPSRNYEGLRAGFTITSTRWLTVEPNRGVFLNGFGI